MLCNNIIESCPTFKFYWAGVPTAMSRVPAMCQEFVFLGQNLDRAITCAFDNNLLTNGKVLKGKNYCSVLSTPVPCWREKS
jgi:hypothetical protein